MLKGRYRRERAELESTILSASRMYDSDMLRMGNRDEEQDDKE